METAPASGKEARLEARTNTASSNQVCTAISRVANELLDSASVHGEQVKHCTDSTAMLGHVSLEMSLHRHTSICPYVNKSLCRIWEEGIPITDKLFGHDLPATLKDIKEMHELGTSLSPIKNVGELGTLSMAVARRTLF